MRDARQFSTVLVTGGCGFIGSHFIRHILRTRPNWTVINLDKLTYAGDPANLEDVAEEHGHGRGDSSPARYRFVQGDICDHKLVQDILQRVDPSPVNAIVHFAAESHVDRSIEDASPFIETNVLGTQVLLEAARSSWAEHIDRREPGLTEVVFLYVSTDEVYGPLRHQGAFTESSPLRPTSPYAVSKTSADLLCQSYSNTYGLPVIIARSSNQYGPNQLPEKLVSKTICNLLRREPIPIYGRGEEIRNWLYVEDACLGLERVLCRGGIGEIYNLSGVCERRNIDLIHAMCGLFDELEPGAPKTSRTGPSHDWIRFVPDPRRAVHDFRYATDGSKAEAELAWSPQTSLEEGLRRTIMWYAGHEEWIDRARLRASKGISPN